MRIWHYFEKLTIPSAASRARRPAHKREATPRVASPIFEILQIEQIIPVNEKLAFWRAMFCVVV